MVDRMEIKRYLRFILSVISAFIIRFSLLLGMPNPFNLDSQSNLVVLFGVFYEINSK